CGAPKYASRLIPFLRLTPKSAPRFINFPHISSPFIHLNDTIKVQVRNFNAKLGLQKKSNHRMPRRDTRSRGNPRNPDMLISKALSSTLRHNAPKEGFKMRSDGYVNVADIVRLQRNPAEKREY